MYIYIYTCVYLYPSEAILQRLPQGYKCDTSHTVHVYPFDVWYKYCVATSQEAKHNSRPVFVVPVTYQQKSTTES